MKYNKFRFDEITLNYDKKRIPLSAMERTKRQGAFRYFGAQGVIDYVDDYIFDGKYLLIAEDGENLKSKRQNIAQIVEGKFWVNNHAHIVKCNEKCILEYLAYLINGKDVSGYITGSAQPKLSQANLNAMEFDIPSIKEQQDILSILLPIEQKIRINKEINENLEQQAGALYQSFFSPKSGTQGEVVTLDAYCSIFTGKKNANASVEGGKYKFFTCAPDALQIDSYIFDGNAIIVSGNGAYTGRTRFYSGRFDLYQRTYACTLFEHINPDYIFPLYWFVKLELSKKIMGGTRGSAIPYIVMNDLAKFEFIYNEETFTTYMPIFKSLTESIQANEFENECLAEIRDALLPRLMSGELDVSELDI